MAVRFIAALLFAVTAAALPGSGQNSADVKAGIAALHNHDFGSARQIFSALVEQDPSAENLNFLGMAEASGGALPEAINHFRESIQKGNNSAAVHYNLGLALARSNNNDSGITEFKTALALDPNYSLATYALGVALIDTGRAKEAIPLLNRVTNVRPQAVDAWANLVRAYFAAGDTKNAESTIDRTTAKFP